MKRTVALAVLLALGNFSAQSQPAPAAQSAPTQQLLAMEHAFTEAIMRGDVATLDRLISEDYTLITWRGDLRTKAELLHTIRNAIRYEYWQTSDVRVRVYGDAAVVTGRSVQTRQENGREENDSVRYTRVYVRRNANWLCVALQMTRTE